MNKLIGFFIYGFVWVCLGYFAIKNIENPSYLLLAGTIVHLLADFFEKLYGMVKS